MIYFTSIVIIIFYVRLWLLINETFDFNKSNSTQYFITTFILLYEYIFTFTHKFMMIYILKLSPMCTVMKS